MPSGPCRATSAVLTAVLTYALVLSGSASARPAVTPVPFPADPVGLRAPGPMGSEVDSPAPYQAQRSCAVEPMRGTVKLRDLVLETYGRGYDGGMVRACTTGSTSEHKEGRAWDWMLDLDNAKDRRAAGDFLAWVTADDGTMAHRLGIMYVIYNEQMWSTWSGGWKPYEGYDPHTSHVHVSLGWNGARARTSFRSGRTWALDLGPCQVFRNSPASIAGRRARTSECPAPAVPARSLARPMLWLGASGDQVRAAQRALGVPAGGTLDAATRSSVLAFQRRSDLPLTGAVDRATWAALRPAQARSLHPEWTAAEARAWIKAAGHPELHRGSAGRAVTALQAVLGIGVEQRTGFFGLRTAELVGQVRQAQKADGSKVTRSVWRQLLT